MMHASVPPCLPTTGLWKGDESSLCIICHEDVATRSTTVHNCGCVYIAHSTCELSMARITNIECCYCRKNETVVTHGSLATNQSAASERSYLTTTRRLITGFFFDVPAALTVAYVMILLENVTAMM